MLIIGFKSGVDMRKQMHKERYKFTIKSETKEKNFLSQLVRRKTLNSQYFQRLTESLLVIDPLFTVHPQLAIKIVQQGLISSFGIGTQPCRDGLVLLLVRTMRVVPFGEAHHLTKFTHKSLNQY